MNYLLGIFPDPLFSLHGMKHNVYQGLHEIKKCVHILYVIQLVNHNIIVLGGLAVEQFFAKPNLFNSSYIEYISKLSDKTYLDEIKKYFLPEQQTFSVVFFHTDLINKALGYSKSKLEMERSSNQM